jgi:hypothetical protein
LPDLVASSLPFDWLGEQSLAFSILIRKRLDTDIQARGTTTPVTPGGVAAAELLSANELDEFWGGLTWGSKVGDAVGVGITTYVAVRNQDRRTQFLTEELKTSGDVATAVSITQFSYQHYRILWKAGIGVDLNPLTLGATITTPGLRLFGSGSVLTNAVSSGYDYDGDGTDDDVLIAAYREEQPVDYESPWSFGGGGSYRFGEARIHFSGEFTTGVEMFELMGTGDFIAQSSGDTTSSNLTHETEGVFNYAIGLEYAFGEKTTGYLSYSTDFAAAVSGSQSTLSIVNYDLSHIGAGAAFNIARWDLVVGAVYSFGSDRLSNAITPVSADVNSELLDRLAGSDVVFNRIRILFGFSYAL